MNHSTDTMTLAKQIIDGMGNPTTEKIVATLYSLEVLNSDAAAGFTLNFWIEAIDRQLLQDGVTFLAGFKIQAIGSFFKVEIA
tara:strand:+ start:1318 stop:1566 length:249 start_codon:yes stop_codon:yes gene_type:complete